MANRPTLYVAVRADYSQYQKDLAEIRAVAKEEGKAIAVALDGAITPGKAQRSLTTITNSLRVLGQQGGKVNLDHVTDGLAQLAKQAGVSTARMEALTQSMAENARAQAMQKALSDLQKQTGMSTLELAKLQASLGDVSGAFGTLARGAKGAAVAAAAFAVGLGEVTRMSLEAQLELDRLRVSYSSVFGDAGAQEQLQVIYDQVNRVGLKYVETAEAAKSFFAAGQGTPLQDQLNSIFKAMTDTGAALQLTTDDMNGAFIALGQMMSKGKVQAEELRGQLGERIPGAFSMAAKAMGMTTAELDKFMADGKLVAEDLLPALADALRDKYARAAEDAADSLQGSLNRMMTQWQQFKANLVSDGPARFLIEIVTNYMESRNDAAAAAKERARLDAKLEASGARKVFTVDESGESGSWGFSDAQRAMIKRMEAMDRAAERQIESSQQKAEQAIAKARAAINDALKNTSGFKEADIREKWQSAVKNINAGIEAAIKEGSSQETIDGLRKNLDQVNKKYQSDLDELAKKSATADKSRASAAKSAAVAQADYTGELERTRQQIDALQQQLGTDPTESLTQAKIRAEQKYQAELSKTREQLAKQVARGSLTQDQANTLYGEKEKAADLQRQLTMREAEKKAQEDAIKLAEAQLSFYKELGAASGEYGSALELQDQILAQQVEKYTRLKIPPEFIDQWKEIQQLELARDPFSGMERAMDKFFAQSTDYATQMEQIWSSTMDGLADGLTEFCMSGKLDFNDLANSFIQMVIRMQMQAMVSGLFKGIGDFVGGLFGGTAAADGGVFTGGISSLSGGVYNKPTFFSYGRSVQKFARGGVLGEAGPEAVMPLARMSNGKLGVQSAGGAAGGVTVPVNIQVINELGNQANVETQQRANDQGGMDIVMFIKRVVSQDISQGNGGMIGKTIENVYQIPRYQRGR